MGSSSSLPAFLTEDTLDEYIQLTYLSRAEILRLYKKFILIASDKGNFNLEERYSLELVQQVFPQLKYNPFVDRICKVFSSLQDDKFSFEDILDLCSVMSESCPDRIKARWAFKIYDFNDDGEIDKEDVMCIIDRLTGGEMNSDRVIDNDDKDHIISVLLKAMDIQRSGSINQLEFEHAVGKMSEFPNSFWFRI